MFDISARSFYGLLAMVELAENYNTKKLVQIKEIAENKKIPINFLEQLLLVLKKRGFIKSVRGKKGGYFLAMPPYNINIIDILSSFEGELNILNLNKDNEFFSFFFKEIEQKIKKELNISLYDFIFKKEEFEKKLVYII